MFNQVIKTLINRILRAIEFEEDFHVMIVIPALPGFSGDIKETSGSMLRKQLYWHLKTMITDKDSLIKSTQRFLKQKKS